MVTYFRNWESLYNNSNSNINLPEIGTGGYFMDSDKVSHRNTTSRPDFVLVGFGLVSHTLMMILHDLYTNWIWLNWATQVGLLRQTVYHWETEWPPYCTHSATVCTGPSGWSSGLGRTTYHRAIMLVSWGGRSSTEMLSHQGR